MSTYQTLLYNDFRQSLDDDGIKSPSRSAGRRSILATSTQPVAKLPSREQPRQKPSSRAGQAETRALLPEKTTRPSGSDSLWWLMALPSFSIMLYAICFFFGITPGDPDIKARIVGSIWGVTHIAGSLVAMGIGPFQFLESARQKQPVVHRWIGRVYMLANTIGGVAGFWVSLNSLAYPIGQWAFALLAAIWLATAFLGLTAIWQRDITGHRRWMTRNFSLTYAAVMLRWQLPLLIFCGMEPAAALTLTGVTCWVPNLVFVERWMQRETDEDALSLSKVEREAVGSGPGR